MDEKVDKLVEYDPAQRLIHIPSRIVEDILEFLYQSTGINVEFPAEAMFMGSINVTARLNGGVSLFIDIERESEAPEPLIAETKEYSCSYRP